MNPLTSQVVMVESSQSKGREFESACALVLGAQWLSGRVFDSRQRGRRFEPRRRHCVMVLEQDTFILA